MYYNNLYNNDSKGAFPLNFYAWDYKLILIHVAALTAFFVLLKRLMSRKAWIGFNILFTAAALAIIAEYSVLGRVPSDNHELVFFAYRGADFYREMILNALLYFPLGLSLTELVGGWSIGCALLISLSIETWQYFAGTGFAQGTDVIMNTFGCAIGALPTLFTKKKL